MSPRPDPLTDPARQPPGMVAIRCTAHGAFVGWCTPQAPTPAVVPPGVHRRHRAADGGLVMARDETFRATLAARTADGGDNTLIVTRQGCGAAGRVWLTLLHSRRTTFELTDTEAGELVCGDPPGPRGRPVTEKTPHPTHLKEDPMSRYISLPDGSRLDLDQEIELSDGTRIKLGPPRRSSSTTTLLGQGGRGLLPGPRHHGRPSAHSDHHRTLVVQRDRVRSRLVAADLLNVELSRP